MPRCRLLTLPLTSQIQVQKDEQSDRLTSCYGCMPRWIEHGAARVCACFEFEPQNERLVYCIRMLYCNRMKGNAIVSFQSMYQMQVRKRCNIALFYLLPTHLGSIPRTCKTTPWSDALFPGRCSHSVDPSSSATSDKTK